MDYKLAAVKVVSSQLKEARQTASQKGMTLGGILFQRVWVQGVLVSSSAADSHKFLLDDGTGLLHLHLSPSPDFRFRPWKIGMYVMVVGAYVVRSNEPPVIKVHKIVDLSAFPDREAMWYLEVMEAYKLFYEPLIEEFIYCWCGCNYLKLIKFYDHNIIEEFDGLLMSPREAEAKAMSFGNVLSSASGFSV